MQRCRVDETLRRRVVGNEEVINSSSDETLRLLFIVISSFLEIPLQWHFAFVNVPSEVIKVDSRLSYNGYKATVLIKRFFTTFFFVTVNCVDVISLTYM